MYIVIVSKMKLIQVLAFKLYYANYMY